MSTSDRKNLKLDEAAVNRNEQKKNLTRLAIGFSLVNDGRSRDPPSDSYKIVYTFDPFPNAKPSKEVMWVKYCKKYKDSARR